MKLNEIKTLGLIGLGAFTLYKIGFFKSDFALWNLGKTQQFTQEATKGVYDGAKEATQDAVKSATDTLDTGARVFIPGWAQIKAIEDLRTMFSEWQPPWITKPKIPTLPNEERVLTAPKVEDIPKTTSSAIRHIQEATGSFNIEPPKTRITTADIKPATQQQTTNFYETRSNLIKEGLSFQEATERARIIN